MTLHLGRRTMGLFTAALLLLLMSACGFGGGTPASPQTPTQVLQHSSDALKQLKSAHLDLKVTVGVQANLATPLPSTSGTPAPTAVTITASGTGDEVLPDKVSLQLTLGILGRNLSFAEITDGNKVFIQNKGQWYVLDKSVLTGSASNPVSTANVPDLSKLLALTTGAQVTDHGTESLNGQSLRHLTITLDKNGLKQLFESSGLAGSMGAAAQQAIDKLFNGSSQFSASLDFWVDESTSYIHRVEEKFTLNLDLSSFATPGTRSTSGNVSINADIVLDLSKFNDPSIKVTDPPNAIPTTNPAGIFSGLQ